MYEIRKKGQKVITRPVLAYLVSINSLLYEFFLIFDA